MTLVNKLANRKIIIQKKKKKYKLVKILYISFITLSKNCNWTVILLSSLTVPPLVVLFISAANTIISAMHLI